MSAPVRPRLAAELLREGRVVEMPLGGSSMRPLLAPGQRLRIEPVGVGDVAPGDVVIVDVGGRLLCHRLVYVRDGVAVTRGDSLSEFDPPVAAGAIVGRVPVAPSPHALYCAVRALVRSLA